MTFGSCPSEATSSPHAHADEAACADNGRAAFHRGRHRTGSRRSALPLTHLKPWRNSYGSADANAFCPERTIPRQHHPCISFRKAPSSPVTQSSAHRQSSTGFGGTGSRRRLLDAGAHYCLVDRAGHADLSGRHALHQPRAVPKAIKAPASRQAEVDRADDESPQGRKPLAVRSPEQAVTGSGKNVFLSLCLNRAAGRTVRLSAR